MIHLTLKMRFKNIHRILIIFLLLLVGNQVGFSHSEALCTKVSKTTAYKSFLEVPHYIQLNAPIATHDTLFESLTERENTNSSSQQPSLLHIGRIISYSFGIQTIGYVISNQNFPQSISLKINTQIYLFLRNLRL